MHVPGFGHLAEFALNAHCRGSAAQQGSGVGAEKLGNVFETNVDFFGSEGDAADIIVEWFIESDCEMRRS